MIEEKAWKELEAGAERKIRVKQNNTLIDQCEAESVKVYSLFIYIMLHN